MQGLYKQMVEIFKSLGIEAVPGAGQPFDPEFHDAIMREENNEVPNNTVLQELRRGFRLGKTLLRPSMVKVCISLVSRQLLMAGYWVTGNRQCWMMYSNEYSLWTGLNRLEQDTSTVVESAYAVGWLSGKILLIWGDFFTETILGNSNDDMVCLRPSPDHLGILSFLDWYERHTMSFFGTQMIGCRVQHEVEWGDLAILIPATQAYIYNLSLYNSLTESGIAGVLLWRTSKWCSTIVWDGRVRSEIFAP